MKSLTAKGGRLEPKPFLTAEWRDLVLLNYEVPESLLAPLVPAGTELDRFEGRLLASVVGFRFLETAIRGWPVPFHQAFEEVNLRFYVRRQSGTEDARRAVVFMRELVPKRAVAWIARAVYNEPYQCVPMTHEIIRPVDQPHPSMVEYRWTLGRSDYRLGGQLTAAPTDLSRPSEAEFITEHYWGYTRQRDGGTLEYRVTHPSWTVAPLGAPLFAGAVATLYGAQWAEVLRGAPSSAFYAAGSGVEVFSGTRIR